MVFLDEIWFEIMIKILKLKDKILKSTKKMLTSNS
jgi:hypothetical protein